MNPIKAKGWCCWRPASTFEAARKHSLCGMEAPAPSGNLDRTVQESSWSGPPTIRCLRGERREAEAQRARALLELEELQKAEKELAKKKERVRKWDFELVEREFKIDFRLKLAQETLKILSSPKTQKNQTANSSTSTSAERRDEEILGILE